MAKDNIILQKSFDFAVHIIDLYRQLVKEKEFIISKQVFRSGTSIGANVEEAIAGQSKKDFIHKMNIVLKEAKETHYWLRLFDKTRLVSIDYSKSLSLADELIKILSSIIKTAKVNSLPNS